MVTSAFFAPGAAIAQMVDAILRDRKRLIPCSVYLEGEYGERNVCIGVPVVLGRGGVERIIELPLNDQERAAKGVGRGGAEAHRDPEALAAYRCAWTSGRWLSTACTYG